MQVGVHGLNVVAGGDLRDAGPVQQLQPVEREELRQDFDALHMPLTVPTAVVLLGPVQPRHHVSTQVATVEAAHLQRVQKDSQRGQQRPS